jgi:hypothetical protein
VEDNVTARQLVNLIIIDGTPSAGLVQNTGTARDRAGVFSLELQPGSLAPL